MNFELGIPCAENAGHSNAIGGMIKKAKEEYNTLLNTQKQYIQNTFGNAILSATTSESLEAAIDALAQEKVNVNPKSVMRVGSVVVLFGKPYKKAKSPNLCNTPECLKTYAATLDAINQFESINKGLVEEKRKNFAKIQKTSVKTRRIIDKAREIMANSNIVVSEAPTGMPKVIPTPTPTPTPTPMPVIDTPTLPPSQELGSQTETAEGSETGEGTGEKSKTMANLPYYIIGALLLIGAYKYFKD